MCDGTQVKLSPGLDSTISIFAGNYLTGLSLLAKRLSPEARIEATTKLSDPRTVMLAFTRLPF